MDDMQDLTITVNGFSKAYAMTGWRLGYVHAPKEIFEQMLKLHSHSVSQATSFVQYAGIAALQGDQSFIQDMNTAFKQRHDFVVAALNDIRGIRCAPADGAFYCFFSVEGAIANTPGVANGIARAWVTNYNSSGQIVSGPTKVVEYTNVGWVAAGHSTLWHKATWSPIYGGNSSGTLAVPQYMWMDQFAVAGK